MRGAMAALLVLALAACGSGGAPADADAEGPALNLPQEQEAQIKVRSDQQDQLHRLSDMDRDIGLKRAITGTGIRCQRVTRSGYVTEYNNLSMWTASCDNGRNYAIFAGPDGTAQVRPCDQMRQFNLPPCVIAKDGRKPAINWRPGDARPEGL